MRVITGWKQRAKQLKTAVYVIYLVPKDRRVPWYTRLLAACVIGYAFSPIDLIPDPIPILGYLDDLVLVPLGIALVLKLVPEPVLADCREQAQSAMEQGKRTNWIAAVVIVAIWLLVLGAIVSRLIPALWR
jgi:uncharacterized membrane protein YkvA (DUF1232 family)